MSGRARRPACRRVYAFRRGRIAIVVLSHPERRNALTLEMWNELKANVSELGADTQTRAIVIRGEGTEAFSAGADITEFPRRRTTEKDVLRYQQSVTEAEAALMSIRKPTIAMIHGACAGGGAGIALSCSLRFADGGLRFSIPAAKLGVVYEAAIVSRLAREVGPSAAFDILISGRTLDADEALRIRLVSSVWPTKDLEARVMEYAECVVANAPLSIEGAWVGIKATEDAASERWQSELAELELRALQSSDYREGVQAFLAKRRPEFLGK